MHIQLVHAASNPYEDLKEIYVSTLKEYRTALRYYKVYSALFIGCALLLTATGITAVIFDKGAFPSVHTYSFAAAIFSFFAMLIFMSKADSCRLWKTSCGGLLVEAYFALRVYGLEGAVPPNTVCSAKKRQIEEPVSLKN